MERWLVAHPMKNGHSRDREPGRSHANGRDLLHGHTDVSGELVPTGGGDPIPLVRPMMIIGRRDQCDICLRFPEVSGRHCRLFLQDGFWFVEDLGSTNGTRVGDRRVRHKTFLSPGDTLQVAKRRFTVNYEAPPGVPFPKDEEELNEVMGQSLLERAGLSRPRRPGDWLDE